MRLRLFDPQNQFRAALIIGLQALIFSACSSGPNPRVVHHRPVNPDTEKIVLLPPSDFAGDKTVAAEDLELRFGEGWTKVIGSRRILPASPAVDELSRSQHEAYSQLIGSLKNPKKASGFKNNAQVRSYLEKVAELDGTYNLAFTVIEGDEQTFDQKQPVELWLGVFDVKAMSWKWVTQAQVKRNLFTGWSSASNSLINSSFDRAKSLDKSRTIVRSEGASERRPASVKKSGKGKDSKKNKKSSQNSKKRKKSSK